MIALTKSGYKKFIEGTLNIPNDTKVAVLSSGLTNTNFSTSNVNVVRAQANSNDREYPFEDFTTDFDASTSKFLVKGQVNLDTTDFFAGGDESIDQTGAVIDTTDSDDLVGAITLYPDSDPITYSALNSNPVNIDYRVNGMAEIQLKTSSSDFVQYQGFAKRNFSDTFPASLGKLPIFDSTTSVNLLTGLKIALLSAAESSESTFKSTFYTDSRTLSTLDNLDQSANYHYISGGFTFRNLGIASNFACLTATDSTLYIPGLTINDEKVFAVIYFEDAPANGQSVTSNTYKQNSYVLNNVQNINDTNNDNIRFAFKQSVIIDAFFDSSAAVTTTNLQPGILAVNNVVGPGFNNSNVQGDIS